MMNILYVHIFLSISVWTRYANLYLIRQICISNRTIAATPAMRNPVDRAIRAMTVGAGLVGIIVLTVFILL